ncbi:MAG: universal stress protein, partial [Solirubrobacteraceae bacterium]
MFNKIVVGYAQDQAGEDAVCLAARIAALLNSDWTVVFPYQPLLSTVPADALEERVRADVEALTRDVDGLRPPGYHWSPSSWPIHALHEMAQYEHADLIVFGSARAKLSDRLHVSLMERVAHAAPCAVAVAPPHYAETGSGELRRIGVGFAATIEGGSALRDGWALAARTGGELHVIAGAALEPELASYASAAANYVEVEHEIY